MLQLKPSGVSYDPPVSRQILSLLEIKQQIVGEAGDFFRALSLYTGIDTATLRGAANRLFTDGKLAKIKVAQSGRILGLSLPDMEPTERTALKLERRYGDIEVIQVKTRRR